MNKIRKGDEVIVNGEILYVEKKAKVVKKAKRNTFLLTSKDTLWQCYDGYGEDRVVKESDMTVKEL